METTNQDVRLKSAKVKNPKNVLIQIPGWIAELWGLQTGDTIDMKIAPGCTQLILTKGDGLANTESNS